jgi:hypothetical protein
MTTQVVRKIWLYANWERREKLSRVANNRKQHELGWSLCQFILLFQMLCDLSGFSLPGMGEESNSDEDVLTLIGWWWW